MHAVCSQLFVLGDEIRKRFFAILLLLVLAIPVYGQSNYAVLIGTITDSQQLAVPGASIELTDINTGAVRCVATNQLGLFEIQGLLPDDYKLKVAAHRGSIHAGLD